MSVKSVSHSIGFPVFSVVCAGNNNEFLVGGGGGGTKAGVKNSVMLFKVDPITLELSLSSEFKFSRDDDGCMSIAAHPLKRVFVCGVNGPADDIKKGVNQNARSFRIQNNNIIFTPELTVGTILSKDPIDYQRVCRFSKDGKMFIAGTTDGHLSFWSWPEMEEALPAYDYPNSEILDIHIDHQSSNVVVVTSSKLRLLDLAKGKVRWSLDDLTVGSAKCELRSARFGSNSSEGILFVVFNSKGRRESYIRKFDILDNWKLKKSKQVASKPITAFNISENGHLLAIGSSDMSVSVLDSNNLSVLLRIPDAHSFPVTTIDFNTNAAYVISGSADGTVAISPVPDVNSSSFAVKCNMLMVFLFVIFVLTIIFIIVPIDELDEYEL
ncbi:quinon protein alcohol dehydrogenase-like superfamily [Globomyces pollinis-pini]|nr:quinon protein alcohol dehydrogenase-like superfamily [Globomyces pollinis-pini]